MLPAGPWGLSPIPGTVQGWGSAPPSVQRGCCGVLAAFSSGVVDA